MEPFCNIQPINRCFCNSERGGNHLEMWEYFSLGFFDEPFELIGIFRGVHYRLIKWISTTICSIFLIPRFLFRIKQCVDVKYTKVLVFVEATGRGLPSKPDRIIFLGFFSLSGLVILGGVRINVSSDTCPYSHMRVTSLSLK